MKPNMVEPTTEFTDEFEIDNTLLLLDALLLHNNDKLDFQVYRKTRK